MISGIIHAVLSHFLLFLLIGTDGNEKFLACGEWEMAIGDSRIDETCQKMITSPGKGYDFSELNDIRSTVTETLLPYSQLFLSETKILIQALTDDTSSQYTGRQIEEWRVAVSKTVRKKKPLTFGNIILGCLGTIVLLN